MQAFSSDKRDFIPLVNSLGLYYQIRDDYINLQSEKYMENKAFCEDLSEGKFSFPIIHSILYNAKDTRLLNILRRRTEDLETKKHAVKYMQSTGSFEYTLTVLAELKKEVTDTLEALGGNDAITKIVVFLDQSM
jgi:geranylgeranyl diphosphate synthase type 3